MGTFRAHSTIPKERISEKGQNQMKGFFRCEMNMKSVYNSDITSERKIKTFVVFDENI